VLDVVGGVLFGVGCCLLVERVLLPRVVASAFWCRDAKL